MTATPGAPGRGPDLTLGRAWDVLDLLLPDLAQCCPMLTRIVPAGDVRRYEPVVSGLVLVAAAADPPAALDAIARMTGTDVRERSARHILATYGRVAVEIRVAAPDEFGTVLFLATGSEAHVSAVSRRRTPGLYADEEQVYQQAGLAFVPPELRHDTGEIEAARSNGLPQLVSRADIRGDLHMHTTFSDGRDRLETMVEICHALGYEYIAISDHSERAGASRTLGIDDIGRQREEIARARERFPGMTILHGVEVDVMPDGKLDFPDEVLKGFDLVLASVHDPAGQSASRLTQRTVNAIRHPLVNILCHPANRLVGRYDGYELDFDAVYEAAVETGTALEIDGAPSHLDLDGERARQAAAAGVVFTIDSDCHRSRSLQRQMDFGVGTARRGWITPDRVLNTRPIADLRAFLEAKRQRG